MQLQGDKANESLKVEWNLSGETLFAEKATIAPRIIQGKPSVVISIDMDSWNQREQFVDSAILEMIILGQKGRIQLKDALPSDALKDVCPGHEDPAAWPNPCPPTDTGLVLWWRFEERDFGDGTFKGSVGDGGSYKHRPNKEGSKPVTTANMATDGVEGRSLTFDGIDDWVRALEYPGILGQASWSVSFWLKHSGPATGQGGTLFQWGDAVGPGDDNRYLIRLRISNGALTLIARDGKKEGTTLVNSGDWVHVAIVMTNDGSPTMGEIQCYINGTLETFTALRDQTIEIIKGENPLQLGVGVGMIHFKGSLDEFKMYDRPLSEAEVKELSKIN